MMTHIETARVNEMLGLQIGRIQRSAGRLNSNDLELLQTEATNLEAAVKELRGMLAGLTHLA